VVLTESYAAERWTRRYIVSRVRSGMKSAEVVLLQQRRARKRVCYRIALPRTKELSILGGTYVF